MPKRSGSGATILVAAGSLSLLCAFVPAFAAQRVYVSPAGVDNPTCSFGAPCRQFTAAVAAVDPNGEVVVLDSAGYGAVAITKNVTITSPAGVYAGISVFPGTDGVTVSAPATKVVLRGLTINGQGGNNGIRVQAGEVHIESTVIGNMGAAGIRVEGGSTVRISGTVVRSSGDGLRIGPGAGTVTVLVRDSEFTANATAGIGLSPGAGGANAQATVERSSVTRNGAGASVSPTGGATAELVLTQSVASENTGAGVSSSGAGATVYVRESTITRNGTGLLQASSGVLNACGGNLLVANGTAESGSINTASCLDVAGSSTIGGSGTSGYLAKWIGSTTLGDSAIYETGGSVGIGTTAPVNRFQIGSAPAFSNNDFAIGNGVDGMSFLLSNGAYTWFSSTNFALMPNTGTGLVGIGTQSPANKLQIGSVGSTGYNGNDIAFGNGTQASAIAQTASVAWWLSNTDIKLMPAGGSGHVGINTTPTTNKLQIGSIGAAPYTGNDIAFGNGTQASAFAQTPTIAWWVSNTDIALMPRGSGHGRVGINTEVPNYPLEVTDYISLGPYSYAYFKATGPDGDTPTTGPCLLCTAQVSIRAANNVLALEFDAASDARMKDIVRVSDSAKDLATIDALEVTDYTLKDKVTNGNKPYKKVIAQQVEKVYPQVVSKHVDYIPNVYQAASSVMPIDSGLLVHFDHPHRLSAQAKRIKLLASNEHVMRRVAIVSIPSDRDMVIEPAHLNGDKVFVYGEEVDDFRTVDYEGLTALNISATQELSKRLARQEAAMAAIDSDEASQLADLRKRVAEQSVEIAILRRDRILLEKEVSEIAERKREMFEMKHRLEAVESAEAEIVALKAAIADMRGERAHLAHQAQAGSRRD